MIGKPSRCLAAIPNRRDQQAQQSRGIFEQHGKHGGVLARSDRV
jgi:hypothetical protein